MSVLLPSQIFELKATLVITGLGVIVILVDTIKDEHAPLLGTK